MKLQKARFSVSALFITLALLLLAGCESNPTDPSAFDDTENAKKAAANTAEIYTTISSVQQVSDVMRGQDAILDFEVADINSQNSGFAIAKAAKKMILADLGARSYAVDKRRGTLGDSLISEITKRNDFEGYTERVRIFYDFATGIAKLQAIKFDFDARHFVEYDSAEAVIDVNKTLENDNDDLLQSFEELKRYKPDQPLMEEWTKFVPDTYTPGTEPTGGVYDHKITYVATNFVSSTDEHAEFHESTGGTFTKDVKYTDGTTSHEKITFAQDGTGTFEEVQRDGTRVDGTFDSADDDGTGSFTKTTTFPSGSDPASIYEAGSFTQNPADSTLHGSFEKEVRLANGTVLRESVQVDESVTNGLKTTKIVISQADGSHGTITFEERTGGAHVSAEWTDADGTFTILSVDYYEEGSARAEFSTYASKEAYDNGDDPILSGFINFNPDNSGSGLVNDGGTERAVTINSDGNPDIG